MHTINKIACSVTLIFVLAFWNPLRAQGADNPSTASGLDLTNVMKELAVFQGVIDTSVKQNLPGPFPILGSTRGTYLPDYGAVFNLEVNVYQIRQLSPFDYRPHTQKELNEAYDKMIKRIESVKGVIINSIADYGTNLHVLKPDENLTVIVYLFSGNTEGKKTFPTQLVLNVKRSILQQYRESKISEEALKQNIRVIQY